MAEGLPTPKSREQIVSEMITEYVGITGINDVNVGSVITQFFDVVARSIARTSGDIFQILRDFSIDRATGEALNRIGAEERVFRRTSQVASGTVQITDTSFKKVETKIYSGASAPNIGSTVIRVSNAENFPASGRLYIGRGTPNIEGPINYNSVSQVGSFWEVTLSAPTTKFHNISESVIVGQGGTRTIPVNTTVRSPGTGATADVEYGVSSAAVLLDGENVNSNIQVVAQEPGSLGNAPAGSVVEFDSEPFPNAAVINLVPFTTGQDEESDDDFRDRIKKERLSKGLGTALAVKNAVLGAQASDENARITSSEIDTTNPEETILYIDNGEGYEEKTEGVGFEFIVDSAIGGEQNFQLGTGGRQTSVAKAFLESSNSAPYNISAFEILSVLVGGVISEHVFGEADFQAPGAATAYEVVASINDNPNLTFEATTSGNGSRVVIRAKSEDNDFIQITSPSSGTDAAPKLGFPSNEANTLLLYRDKELLNKDGRTAFVVTRNQFDWSNAIGNGDTLIISVDGTDFITYTFLNQDFITEGQNPTVSNQNNLSAWANVINSKITGVSAEVNGEQLKLTSNLGSSNRASIQIDPLSDLVVKGMFSAELGLSAQGNEADFDFSRNTAQIKLNTPLIKGQKLNMGSEFTRAEIESNEILGGQTTIPSTAYIWLVVDDTSTQPVEIGVTADTFLTVTKPGSGIVRYESTTPNSFDNVEVGDYVVIWSEEVSVQNRLEGRVNAKTSTTLDLRVTATEEAAAVAEGPVLYSEGLTIFRTEFAPQKLKVDAGVYNINEIAQVLNAQLENAEVSIDNDAVFIFRTNTESTSGALFIADFNNGAKPINLIKNSKSVSLNSQVAFYETGFNDKQFPLFIHGKITADNFADPDDTNINTIKSSENLASLGADPSGYMCLAQPYGNVRDALSTECVEIERYVGTTVNVEDSFFNKRNRVDDRYYLINPYDFGHEDSIVAVLDNDPTGKTFNMPLYRTAVTNIQTPANPNNFRAFDKEGGNTTFTEFFGNDYAFDNYKALMQAKNVVDPTAMNDEDAIFYRAVEWGRSGEKIGIAYSYPTTADQDIQHIVTVGNTVDINIFLKSGGAISTTIDGTTEWNVSISPLNATTDLVTYTWSGVGTDPGLVSVNSGDYVSILNTGEFVAENQGAYRVESATTVSFTVKRPVGVAVTQSNVATSEINTISFFSTENTTAQEIVDYAVANLSDYVTASIIADNGTTGAGIIDLSTSEDSDFTYDYIRLLDGKNYILSSDLDAIAPNEQFVFKTPLDLDTYSTNTVDAYSFNNGEEVKLIPLTSLQVKDFYNILAVTGYTTLGKIKSVNRNSNIQLSTDILGTGGAVQIAGGTGTSSTAAIEGSASTLGDQSDRQSIVTIINASSQGFHSDQWVKLFASDVQRKVTNIDGLNTIQITNAVPNVNQSKIEFFSRRNAQRFLGRNRYHTRTRGRTFKVEKQGEFTCISWDENGSDPSFLKTSVDVKDASASTVTISANEITGLVELTVDTGDMRFDEINFGDVITVSNRDNAKNNGNFIVLGRSDDGKTLNYLNVNAIDELVSGSFTITDNVAVLGASFVVGANALVEGVDFVAGVDTDETALNLSSAISLLPNIVATSDASVVNIVSEVPNVSVPISASAGATASDTQLNAPTSNTGDITARTEVTEGDSVSISAPFSVLNQGVFRVIRRFKNSIYIDNPNTVEEEVTLGEQAVEFFNNQNITSNLVFTNGSAIVTSVGAVSWTSLLAAGDFIKDASRGDSYYYEILSIDSPSQVTLTTTFNETSSGASGFPSVYSTEDISNTNYNIEKVGAVNTIKWGGSGAEPAFENASVGDVLYLGTDFDAANQGEFHILSTGEKLQEITRFTQSRGVDITSGQYALIYSADDADEFYIWYNVDGLGGDPVVPGKIGIEVAINSSDTPAEIADKKNTVINNSFSTYFSSIVDGDSVVVTTVGFGETTDASDVNIDGLFTVKIEQQGRKNFASYINVNGIAETSVVVTDVLEINQEALKFKDYEGIVPGDAFIITSNFLGENNAGRYVVQEVLNETTMIVSGVTEDTEVTLLDSDFNRVYIEEASPYVGYKQIQLVAANPANLSTKNVVFDSDNQFQKIGEIGGVSMSAVGKMQFPTEVVTGVDAYKFHTGLIGEANRIVYGEPRDNTTYPGVAAAGAEIFTKAPLVRRVQVSINVRVKTGVPFSTIVEEVRNSVSALINSNDVGQPIPISNIISNVDAIIGVQAVAISSPQYDAQNDVIRVNSGEKALVLDIVSDVLVSKID